jgi:tripartite-type tricarboxylate transporter receptor subunit TctC
MSFARLVLQSAALTCIACSTAFAQSFPTKPIQMVVPYPPGGIDPYARVMLPHMSKTLGQNIVIENRPGANGIIGSREAARATPDGHTILFATSSTLVGGIFMIKDVNLDPLKDFAPITLMFEPLQVLAVPANVPAASVKELVDYAKKNPGKLSYGSSGIGSVFHLNGELFKQSTGTFMVHIPYGGTGPLATELLAGRIDVAFPALSNVKSFLSSGKVKVLALAEPKRWSGMPDVPIVAETVKGFRKAPSWIAMFAPAGTPRAAVDRLHSSIVTALNAPDVRKYHEDNGSQIIAQGPAELTAAMKGDLERVGKLIKALGIKPE